MVPVLGLQRGRIENIHVANQKVLGVGRDCSSSGSETLILGSKYFHPILSLLLIISQGQARFVGACNNIDRELSNMWKAACSWLLCYCWLDFSKVVQT